MRNGDGDLGEGDLLRLDVFFSLGTYNGEGGAYGDTVGLRYGDEGLPGVV